MDSTIHISVITASYNSAGTLADTLRSVRKQSHPAVEHIVVDGHSQDATPEVMRTHGGHVARFLSEPDHGIYDAMNKGVALSTGDVIAFLNSDDRYAHSEVLAHVAQLFASQPLDAVLGDVAFFRPEQPDRLIRRYRSHRFNPRALAWGWMPAHPAIFVRRDVFKRFGAFKTDYRIAGDYEWVARAFGSDQLRYHHLPKVLVHMQTGGASTRGWSSTMLLNREVMRACRENGITTSWFRILSKYPAKLLEYVRL